MLLIYLLTFMILGYLTSILSLLNGERISVKILLKLYLGIILL